MRPGLIYLCLVLTSLLFPGTIGNKLPYITLGPAETSLGGGGTAQAVDSEALNLNPAIISHIRNFELAFSHLEHYNSMRFDSLRAVFLPGRGPINSRRIGLGAHLLINYKKNITVYDTAGQVSEVLSHLYKMVRLAAAYNILDSEKVGLSAGLGMTLSGDRAAAESAVFFDTDLGMHLVLILPEDVRRVLGKRFKAGMKYSIAEGLYSAAVSVKWFNMLSTETGLKNTAFKIENQRSLRYSLYLSLELFLGKRFVLRTGINGDDREIVSFGFGILPLRLKNSRLSLDAGFVIGPVVRNKMVFGVRYAFRP